VISWCDTSIDYGASKDFIFRGILHALNIADGATVVLTEDLTPAPALAAGDTAVARKALGELKRNWHAADATLPELEELNRLLARVGE